MKTGYDEEWFRSDLIMHGPAYKFEDKVRRGKRILLHDHLKDQACNLKCVDSDTLLAIQFHLAEKKKGDATSAD